MFEFTLSENSSCQLIDFLHNYLSDKIKDFGGIIVKQSYSGRTSVCLAVDDQFKDLTKGIIIDAVADAIIFVYKPFFLNNNIRLFCQNKKAFDSFIQALVAFDRQTDKDIIKKNLVLDKQLFVDSFYNFRLFELRERWSDVCSIVNESIPMMLKNKSVAEITKYFVDATDDQISEVHLFADNGKIVLSSDNAFSDIEYSTCGDWTNNLVCEIISLSPSKIILHGKTRDIELLEDALSGVFYGKLYRAK